MDYLRTLVVAGLLAVGTAHAGYAHLAPPAGFGGSPGNWTFAPSANDVRYGPIAYQPNGLRVPVPGSATTMPAAYRFAANAPRIAAAAIFAHPWVRAGVGIAAWLGAAGLLWDSVDGVWKRINQDDGLIKPAYKYNISGYPGYYETKQKACDQYASMNGFPGNGVMTNSVNCVVYSNNGSPYNNTSIVAQSIPCPDGWTSSPAGCLSPEYGKHVKIHDADDFLRRIADSPMPDTVPWELPYPTPLPVDQPWINPQPGQNPEHRPFFVPTGDPVPNPNYDPNAAPGPNNQPWFQPGFRGNPSPTVNDPWRVDLQPTNRPQPGPDPLPEPNPEDPNNPDKPKPEEEQSLCEKHPDIVACQKLGSLNADPLSKNTVPLAINREEGFGPSDGLCPAPKQFVIMGKQMAFRWDLLCDFATQIKPLLVGFAYLSAALAFLGLSRKD